MQAEIGFKSLRICKGCGLGFHCTAVFLCLVFVVITSHGGFNTTHTQQDRKLLKVHFFIMVTYTHVKTKEKWLISFLHFSRVQYTIKDIVFILCLFMFTNVRAPLSPPTFSFTEFESFLCPGYIFNPEMLSLSII